MADGLVKKFAEAQPEQKPAEENPAEQIPKLELRKRINTGEFLDRYVKNRQSNSSFSDMVRYSLFRYEKVKCR